MSMLTLDTIDKAIEELKNQPKIKPLYSENFGIIASGIQLNDLSKSNDYDADAIYSININKGTKTTKKL